MTEVKYRWSAPGVHVAGVTFIEGYLDKLYELRTLLDEDQSQGDEGPAVVLVPNPDNPYDANAVEVHVAPIGMIGHLPRALAATVSPEIRLGWPYLSYVRDVVIHPDHPDRPGLVIDVFAVVVPETPAKVSEAAEVVEDHAEAGGVDMDTTDSGLRERMEVAAKEQGTTEEEGAL
jgi:hypothetical protein